MSQAGFKPGVGRVTVIENCKATALTTQPPRLDKTSLEKYLNPWFLLSSRYSDLAVAPHPHSQPQNAFDETCNCLLCLLLHHHGVRLRLHSGRHHRC